MERPRGLAVDLAGQAVFPLGKGAADLGSVLGCGRRGEMERGCFALCAETVCTVALFSQGVGERMQHRRVRECDRTGQMKILRL